MKKIKKTMLIILVLLILCYISYAMYLLIVNPTDTYIVKEGSVSEEDTSTGYIIRNEYVEKRDNYENGIYQQIQMEYMQ